MKPLIIVILLVGLVILIIQNSVVVSLHFFFWHKPLSLAVVIFCFFVFGALVGYALPNWLHKKRDLES